MAHVLFSSNSSHLSLHFPLSSKAPVGKADPSEQLDLSYSVIGYVISSQLTYPSAVYTCLVLPILAGISQFN